MAVDVIQVKRVRCESSGVLVPKDKAIKRFIVRNIVDASAIRDIQDASVLEGEVCNTACWSLLLPMLCHIFEPQSCWYVVNIFCIASTLALLAQAASLYIAEPTDVHVLTAGYALPKIYRKVYYSVSAAIHSKVVRVRSVKDRRNRAPPPRYRPGGDRPQGPPGAPGAPGAQQGAQGGFGQQRPPGQQGPPRT